MFSPVRGVLMVTTIINEYIKVPSGLNPQVAFRTLSLLVFQRNRRLNLGSNK